MTDPAETFEAERPRLLAIAYGMLGSLADAEDVVQDALRRRREDYVGVWLPEPVVRIEDGPAALTGSLSLALLRVVEALSPVERAVFLLCEAFGYGHAEVARMIGKTEANTGQILHRARKRVTAERPRSPASR